LNQHLKKQVRKIYEAVNELERLFPGRPFTPDGHLVGSLGECLVASAYKLSLMPPSNKGYDAITQDRKQVEIKATQAKNVAFRSCPEYAIVIRIDKEGGFEEIYNGPGDLIWREFTGRKRPSNGQYQISLHRLSALNKSIPPAKRIPRHA